ncbi:MAG: hypothetical protein NC548_44430 [Lachnospiraceae bacterium]|nr:hypothetical protein [Lachnospiraceae bacterium]
MPEESSIVLNPTNTSPELDAFDDDSLVVYNQLIKQLRNIKKELDGKVSEYKALLKSIKFWKRATGAISILASIAGVGILYCASAYVNKVEQRYSSYKENVEDHLENYEKRFSDLKDYCMAVQCKGNE